MERYDSRGEGLGVSLLFGKISSICKSFLKKNSQKLLKTFGSYKKFKTLPQNFFGYARGNN
jgi:hypothetical protein